MTTKEYEDGVMQTWNHTRSAADQVHNSIYGLAGETGELVDSVKKATFHGVSAESEDFVKEAGDVLYYLTAFLLLHGHTLEETMILNHRKLAARYPDGFVLGGGSR